MELIPAWIAIIIIAREFIVTGLRIVALTMEMVIPAEMGGKIKVTAQIASIITLLVDLYPNQIQEFVDIILPKSETKIENQANTN